MKYLKKLLLILAMIFLVILTVVVFRSSYITLENAGRILIEKGFSRLSVIVIFSLQFLLCAIVFSAALFYRKGKKAAGEQKKGFL